MGLMIGGDVRVAKVIMMHDCSLFMCVFGISVCFGHYLSICDASSSVLGMD